MIATEITQKKTAAPTNQAQLETFQNSFNDTIGDLIKSRDKLIEGEQKGDAGQSDIYRAYEIMQRQIDKHGLGD